MTISNNLESVKARNWCFLVYPDSTDKYWLDFLINTGAKFCVSPLHDADVITKADFSLNKKHFKEMGLTTGDVKKPHYHVIFCSNGPTTYNFIKKRVCEPINATNPFSLVSVSGMYKYLVHDQELYPSKHEYALKDRKSYNGFNPADFIEMTSKENAKIIDYIIDFIVRNNIKEYSDVLDFFMLNHMDAERYVFQRNYSFFRIYLDSRRHRISSNIKLKYELQDFETGEIKTVILKPQKLNLHLDERVNL